MSLDPVPPEPARQRKRTLTTHLDYWLFVLEATNIVLEIANIDVASGMVFRSGRRFYPISGRDAPIHQKF
jgi:hypothetical protein